MVPSKDQSKILLESEAPQILSIIISNIAEQWSHLGETKKSLQEYQKALGKTNMIIRFPLGKKTFLIFYLN